MTGPSFKDAGQSFTLLLPALVFMGTSIGFYFVSNFFYSQGIWPLGALFRILEVINGLGSIGFVFAWVYFFARAVIGKPAA